MVLKTMMPSEFIKASKPHSNAATTDFYISFWKNTTDIIPLLNVLISSWNQGSSKINLLLFKDINVMSFPDSVSIMWTFLTSA